jgi:heme-degrading monooxygenase HmoA
MITILTAVEVAPGREGRWEELWRQRDSLHGKYPGLRAIRLLRATDRRGSYTIYTEWDDRAHADAYVCESGELWLLDALNTSIANWTAFEEVEEAAPPS